MSPSKRKLPVTDDQKDSLLLAMAQNEGLSSKKLSATYTFKKYNDEWTKLSNKLNNLGPSKSVREWQKVIVFTLINTYITDYYTFKHNLYSLEFLQYWNDRRSRLKRKIAEQKKSKLDASGNEIMVTGEGSPEIDNLSIYDKKVLEVCGGQTWYQRRPPTKELGAFSFPVELEKTTISEPMSTESTIIEPTIAELVIYHFIYINIQVCTYIYQF